MVTLPGKVRVPQFGGIYLPAYALCPSYNATSRFFFFQPARQVKWLLNSAR